MRALPGFERREVGELLAKGRLVTITGAGGSGRTRLGHALAQDRVEQHPDGVVWVELARITDGTQVASAVVSACGSKLDVRTRTELAAEATRHARQR